MKLLESQHSTLLLEKTQHNFPNIGREKGMSGKKGTRVGVRQKGRKELRRGKNSLWNTSRSLKKPKERKGWQD